MKEPASAKEGAAKTAQPAAPVLTRMETWSEKTALRRATDDLLSGSDTMSKCENLSPGTNDEGGSKEPAFRLFDLPQELVDMVYKRMLRANFYQILDVSRKTRSEASRFLKSDGVYKIVLEADPADGGNSNWVRAVKLDDRSTGFVKDVEICMTSKESGSDDPSSWVSSDVCCGISGEKTAGSCHRGASDTPLGIPANLIYPKTPRDECHVILATDASDRWTIPRSGRIQGLKYILDILTGFAHVTFLYQPQNTPSPGFVYKPLFDRFVVEDEAVYSIKDDRESLYEVFESYLLDSLGPSNPIDDDPELKKGIEFFPLRFKEERLLKME